jgi:hypothetical protein
MVHRPRPLGGTSRLASWLSVESELASQRLRPSQIAWLARSAGRAPFVAPSHRSARHQLVARLSAPHEDTIRGHVIERFGRLPLVGETIELNGYRVEVLELGDATIRTLRIQPDHAAEPDG